MRYSSTCSQCVHIGVAKLVVECGRLGETIQRDHGSFREERQSSGAIDR